MTTIYGGCHLTAVCWLAESLCSVWSRPGVHSRRTVKGTAVTGQGWTSGTCQWSCLSRVWWDLEESVCRAPPPGLCHSTQGILKVAKTKFFSKVLQDLPWFEKGCVKSSPWWVVGCLKQFSKFFPLLSYQWHLGQQSCKPGWQNPQSWTWSK